jgi:hypothetical protein
MNKSSEAVDRVIEHSSSVHKALGSIPSTANTHTQPQALHMLGKSSTTELHPHARAEILMLLVEFNEVLRNVVTMLSLPLLSGPDFSPMSTPSQSQGTPESRWC